MKLRSYARSRLVRTFGLLSAFSFGLLVLPLPSFRSVDMTATSAVQPFIAISDGGVGFVQRLFRRLGGGNAATIAELRDQVRMLETRMARQEELLRAAQDKLRDLTGDQPDTVATVAIAEVIGADAGDWRHTILVNRGSLAGVRRNTIAVWQGAVIGRVVAVGPKCCRVLLLTDPESRVAARVKTSRTHGILAGAGENICNLRYVGYRDAIEAGDVLVTAGTDGVYPPHYLLGRCVPGDKDSGELLRHIRVEPWVRPDQVEIVQLITWQPPDTAIPPTPEDSAAP